MWTIFIVLVWVRACNKSKERLIPNLLEKQKYDENSARKPSIEPDSIGLPNISNCEDINIYVCELIYLPKSHQRKKVNRRGGNAGQIWKLERRIDQLIPNLCCTLFIGVIGKSLRLEATIDYLMVNISRKPLLTILQVWGEIRHIQELRQDLNKEKCIHILLSGPCIQLSSCHFSGSAVLTIMKKENPKRETQFLTCFCRNQYKEQVSKKVGSTW